VRRQIKSKRNQKSSYQVPKNIQMDPRQDRRKPLTFSNCQVMELKSPVWMKCGLLFTLVMMVIFVESTDTDGKVALTQKEIFNIERRLQKEIEQIDEYENTGVATVSRI